VTNADIAEKLMSLAQLLSAQKENKFKIKAYRRAAKTIAAMPDSLVDLVRDDADLTEYPAIGKAISGAIREIASNGTLRQLEEIRAQVKPEIAAIAEYPRLDPARVLRIFKKLGISSVEELKAKLASGEIGEKLGARMEQHVRQALADQHEMLLYDADRVVAAVEDYLLTRCPVSRVEATGDYRRRVEVVKEISCLVETDDFPAVIAKLDRYGGGMERLSTGDTSAVFKLSSGLALRIQTGVARKWGLEMILSTGSFAHLHSLESAGASLANLAVGEETLPNESAVYRKLGLRFIEPELREGRDEVRLAASGTMPRLITAGDIRGDLHAHSTASDGSDPIEQMASAAQKKGYEYVGITDHSQSLKIAGGLPEDDLWKQIRYIDKLNERNGGIRILKSAEVDILADGALDYSDELLRELDYTVCSIHSRFGLGKTDQTERIMRAMDSRYFTILGHATGRLLLKRPGYEIDLERVIEHARMVGCFFEMNSSPDRLDLSADHCRLAAASGVKIAISTDAHSTREYDLLRCGIDQARRAGLQKESILNARSWLEFQPLIRR
jgi:DNA polymerase (family X)